MKPFGWLLRVLQEEHADETAFRVALEVAVSEISRLGGTEDTHLREALNYLILLIFHRRSEDERDAFIDIVKEKSRDETEVEIMAQTAAEVLIEQGAVRAKREAVLKLLAHQFGSVPQPLATHIAQLHHIPQLDALLLFFKKMKREARASRVLGI